MLARFAVANFRSFSDRQELSLVASGSDESNGVFEASNQNLSLLRCAAVYGANASGKTNLFRALAFMRAAVVDSHRNWAPGGKIPVETFQLDPSWAERPSSFEADLVLDGTRFSYRFDANSERIVYEALHAFPASRRQTWFERDPEKTPRIFFGKFLQGENRTIESLTRPNSLFLSAAAQNNHEQLKPLYGWFAKRLHFVNRVNRQVLEAMAAEACSRPGAQTFLASALRAADVGIREFSVVDEALPDEQRELVKRLLDAFGREELKSSELPETVKRLQFRHGGAASTDFPVFGPEQESDGTLAFLGILGQVATAAADGGTLVVDELDASIHPLLSQAIVRLFNDSERDIHAPVLQLVFNTHDTSLLDANIFRRDQVWFVEKGADGSSRVYPLTDYRPRKGENLRRGYLMGRYGGVPVLSLAALRVHGPTDAEAE